MPQKVGTISRGLIAPIIHTGDDIGAIAVDTLLSAAASEGFSIQDRDILALTESVIARAQGNYASVDHIAADIKNKFGNDHIALVFPILSRNRFAICLEGIAKAGNQLTLILSYPSDEVGNRLLNPAAGKAEAVNPWTDSFTAEEFTKRFGSYKHPFTGIDYIAYYQSIIKKYNPQSSILLSNDPCTALRVTKSVLACDIHSREATKAQVKAHGAIRVYGLDDILSESVDGSGYNSRYGLLGSNKATEKSVKLFPNDCQPLVEKIQAVLKEKLSLIHI